MKVYRYIFIGSSLLLTGYACNKSYLDKRPLGYLDEAALANKKGVESLLIGAYSLLDGIGGNKSDFTSAASNWIYGSICGSEAYKGSDKGDQEEKITPVELFESTPDILSFASKWGTVYDGVQRANDVLRIMSKAKDISPEEQRRIAGEARFLRAHYHFEAKKMWNKVPFIDEMITYENGNYRVSNEKDIWPDIEKDLLFAIENLNEIPYANAIGRATKFTARALLAKAYMFQKKFGDAKLLLEIIINSGRFRLNDLYSKNFDPETKNNDESIFSVQMSVNDGATAVTGGAYNNGNFGDVLNFPFIPGQNDCCGFFQPSQYLVNHYKTDADGLPDFGHFNDISVKNDEGYLSTDTFTLYGGFLDPRIDWTIGRRGIPYLDWGIHPGQDWIRDQARYGPYAPKKNVYRKSQQGRLTDASFWSNGTTTNNVNLIRYADVLLWAAEAEVETGGDLNKARNYVNEIRRRAGKQEGWVYTYIDANNPSLGFTNTPAANYKVGEYLTPWLDPDYARKAIRYERMLELAMEGHRFFDLVRWEIADIEIAIYKEKEQVRRPYLSELQFTKNKNEYFPIPQTQIDLSAGPDGIAKIKQNPYY